MYYRNNIYWYFLPEKFGYSRYDKFSRGSTVFWPTNKTIHFIAFGAFDSRVMKGYKRGGIIPHDCSPQFFFKEKNA